MSVTENNKLLGKKINIIGIVGQNGKSIIGQIIHHCYFALEIDNKLESVAEFSNKIHDESYEKSTRDVIMEVCLCSIKEKKASYIDFDSLIFTNSSENADQDEKWTMMRPFIALPLDKTAIINIDDDHGADFCDVTIAKTLTYAITELADINACDIKMAIDKTEFDLYYKGSFACKAAIPYFGVYNVYNALAAVAHLVGEGYDPARVAQLLSSLPQIKGNFDTFTTHTDIKIVVDYARTAEGVTAVLKSLTTVCQGNIITVIGADDDTTTAQRAAIGKNVLAHSKKVIFTTDNPRTEEPQNIIYDLIKGNIKQNYRICIDREKAIEIALKMAKPKDVVILFGKAYEKTSTIYKNTNAFCDKTIAKYLAHKFEI